MQETLTFEAMPQAILELMHKVDSLRADIGELKRHCQPPQVSERSVMNYLKELMKHRLVRKVRQGQYEKISYRSNTPAL